jgi:DNA primase
MTETATGTQTTETQTQVPATTETPPEQPQINSEQWNEFVGTLVQQNNALQTQVNAQQYQSQQKAAQERQEQINSLPDKDRADALANELAAIKNAGQAAQAQEISNSVWQRRDADAAARLLQLHNLNGTEAELYRGQWDVNWMPRFVASVEGMVKGKQQASTRNQNAASNQGNRANVGGSTSSALPEIDPNASGFDTIRFALARGKP